jgi:RNA polymerase sigma factor (sigma-70 family)
MLARSTTGTATLVRSARDGDDRAWKELVARFDGLLRGVAKGYRLAPEDVDDVVQTAWIRAYCNVGRLNDPAAIAGWLVITTRREALRHLQRGVREFPTDIPPVPERADVSPTEALALERERDAAIRDAVRRLNGRQRAVLKMMLAEPGLSYDELSAQLDMPVGSIGPTRERALGRLRQDTALLQAVAR